jgi:hypothetical protein
VLAQPSHLERAMGKSRYFFAKMLLLATALVFGFQNAQGEELIYGPEWTFTSEKMIDKFTALQAYQEIEVGLAQYYKQLCSTGKCTYDPTFRILEVGKQIRINFNRDPGVIEIQTTPKTSAEWKQLAPFIQEHVFDVLISLGAKPHEREGAGHLNIGAKYFEKKPLLFRNFVVDFYNHPGLGTVLNSLMANIDDAAYLHEMNESFLYTKEELEADLKKLKKLDAKNSQTRLSTYVAGESAPFSAFEQNKYVALRLHISNKVHPSHQRLEIRTLRPQQSMRDFLSAIEVYEARIHHLEKNFSAPIKPLPPVPVVDGWTALGEFADYLSDSGLDWKKYRNLMPEMWRNLDEKNFVRGKVKTEMVHSGIALKCSAVFK